MTAGSCWIERAQQSTPDGKSVSRKRRGATAAVVVESAETTAEAVAQRGGADGSGKRVQRRGLVDGVEATINS